MDDMIEAQLGYLCSDTMVKAIGGELFPLLLGKLLAQAPTDDAVRQGLCEIPSETTAAERNSLYHWFRYFWDGKGDVLEVGPFLGGTTRSIALGMLDNASRVKEQRLITVDRFSSYYTGERLVDYLTPLFKSGKLAEDWRYRLSGQDKIPFLELYKCLHSQQKYWPLLSVEEGVLADNPDSRAEGATLFLPDPRSTFSAVFIDGCKSWYSVKYLMTAVVPQLSPGSFVISQDYGWFTCFWLPMFFEMFSANFELLACTDTSYFFRFIGDLDLSQVDRLYVNHPRELGYEAINEIFESITKKAARRNDLLMVVVSQLQKACAFAVIRRLDDAYRVVAEVQGKPYADKYSINIKRTIDLLATRFDLSEEQTHLAHR